MVWYRARVSESQRHTPTQKYTEYLPRVFSAILKNIDGCWDDHGVPLFVLSLLGSHDSVSLYVILLNKIRFVYDFVIIQIY